MSRIGGGEQPRSTWFGAVLVAQGKRGRPHVVGQMWTEAICSSSPDEDYSEPLGIVTGAVAGDAALSSLGSTADERAVQRADERAARADAALRGFGIEPRRL
jgi:hypothetical protein